MTTYYQDGSEVAVVVEFTDSEGNILVPDDGSVNASLYDSFGVKIPAHSGAVSWPSGNTDFTIILGSDVNTLQAVEIFAMRTLRVTGKSMGKLLHWETQYTIAQPKYTMFSKDEVRSELLLNSSELPDSAIPLVEKVVEIEGRYPELATHLFNPTTLEGLKARTFLNVSTALACIPKLRVGLMFGEKTDRHDYTRQTIKWDEVEMLLNEKANNLLNEIITGTIYVPTIFQVTSPTDIVTGA